jgi:hypothetical protein
VVLAEQERGAQLGRQVAHRALDRGDQLPADRAIIAARVAGRLEVGDQGRAPAAVRAGLADACRARPGSTR